MGNPLTDHPAEAGLSYWQHLTRAGRFGLLLTGAGAVCFVHALLPFLFTGTASGLVERVHDEMLLRTSRRRSARVFRS